MTEHEARPRTYVIEAGDTLAGIALEVYGDADLAIELADVNGIRDPRRIRPGQILETPPEL